MRISLMTTPPCAGSESASPGEPPGAALARQVAAWHAADPFDLVYVTGPSASKAAATAGYTVEAVSAYKRQQKATSAAKFSSSAPDQAEQSKADQAKKCRNCGRRGF